MCKTQEAALYNRTDVNTYKRNDSKLLMGIIEMTFKMWSDFHLL